MFCEKPTGYDMPRDDDGNRHRKYRTFCPEHEVIASKQDEDETRSHEDYGDS